MTTKMKKKFEAYIVCKSCGGTGLYRGMAEKDGCAVVCHTCDGTGKYHYEYEYEDFTERKIIKDVKRVYASSHGFCHGVEDVTTSKWLFIPFSKAGCTYEEWLKGVPPRPVEELYCPFTWENQAMQEKKDKFYPLYKARCDGVLGAGSYIPGCPHNKDKATCWKLYWEIDKKAGGKK